MFTVLFIMLAGIAVGYALRNKNIKITAKIITLAIWSLLFFLGVAVGANKDIMNNLHTIGLDALIITLAALFGTYVVSWMVWKFIFSKGGKDEK